MLLASINDLYVIAVRPKPDEDDMVWGWSQLMDDIVYSDREFAEFRIKDKDELHEVVTLAKWLQEKSGDGPIG